MNWIQKIGFSKFNLRLERYLNWLNSKVSRTDVIHSKTLFNKFISVRTLPANYQPKDELLFKKAFAKEFEEARVFRIKNPVILYNFILARPGLFGYAPHFHIRGLTLKGLSKLRLLFKSSEAISKGVWITDNWSFNYFHWFLDALPRLVSIEEYLEDHLLILPEELKQQRFIVESLAFFNIQVKFSTLSKKLFVGELLLPTHLASSGNFNRTALLKLREKFIPANTIEPFRKIYISRSKALKRKITNEKELTELLVQFGFEIHCFEDYELAKQISLMKETKYLIGLHGAGLTNMLFMPPRGKILELRKEGEDLLNWFFILASDLDHDYYYLLNEGNHHEAHLADLYIDLNKLKVMNNYFI